jgi:hypothetical protein
MPKPRPVAMTRPGGLATGKISGLASGMTSIMG